jgi:hypothetical protein
MEFAHTRACAIGDIPHVNGPVIKLERPYKALRKLVLPDCYKGFPLQVRLAVLLVELLDRAIPALNGFRLARSLTDIAC